MPFEAYNGCWYRHMGTALRVGSERATQLCSKVNAGLPITASEEQAAGLKEFMGIWLIL